MTDQPRPCRHKHPHQHGTNACYVLDKCRCDACTTAARGHNREYRRRLAYAAWNPDLSGYVDADPVRAHLRALSAAGMGWKRAAAAAGVGASTVYPILYGKHVDDPTHPEHRPVRSKVRRDIADQILAVQPTPAGGTLVDAIGTTRRLQALVALGWSQTKLAADLGLTKTAVGHLTLGKLRRTTVGTRDAVIGLYDRLWDVPAPPSYGRTRALACAAAHGWLPPMCWDDDTIDSRAARRRPGLVRAAEDAA